MVGRLIQPCRVQEEGPLGCKLLLDGNKPPDALGAAGTVRISTG